MYRAKGAVLMGEYRDPKTVNYNNLTKYRLYLSDPGIEPTKEVTIGKWNGEIRLDIRKWKDGCLGKGISLTEDEVRELRKILEAIPFGK